MMITIELLMKFDIIELVTGCQTCSTWNYQHYHYSRSEVNKMGKIIEMQGTALQLSKEQATSIFMKECILIGNHDSITTSKVQRLLGVEACEYVLSCKKAGDWWNVFGVGEKRGSLYYLTFQGFMQAVSYHNVCLELRGEQNDTGGCETH